MQLLMVQGIAIQFLVIVSLKVGFLQAQITFPNEPNPGPQGKLYFCDRNGLAGPRSTWDVPAHLTSLNQTTLFSLGLKDVNCSHTSIRNFSLGSSSVEAEFQLRPDAYLQIHTSEGADYFSTKQYCISRLTESHITLKICQASCSPSEPCIRKCCPLGSVYHFNTHEHGCTDSGPRKWSPKIFRNPKDPGSLTPEKDVERLEPFYQLRGVEGFKRHCLNERDPSGRTSHVILNPYGQKALDGLLGLGYFDGMRLRFRVREDGMVAFRNKHRKWGPFPHEHYCVDGISVLDPMNYNNTLEEEVIIACPPPVEAEARSVGQYYGIFLICSSLFAFVTVIVYFLLFDKKTVHGWTTQSHSASVACLFVFLGASHLSITKRGFYGYGTPGCKFIGTMAHYFFISTFVWLTCISYDLRSKFSSVSAASRKKGLRRFLCYCGFGWGVPALVVAVSWTLEVMYKSDEDSEVAVPSYGDDFCYITPNFYWEFIYGPIAVLLGLNLVLFAFTSVQLYQLQQSTRMATQRINRDRQSFMLFVKLFFVVGTLWIFEIISFAVSGAHVAWYWQILDSLNILQPVAIFVIFVLKSETINALHERYIVLRPIVYPARRLLQVLYSNDA